MKLPDMSEHGETLQKYGRLAIIVIGMTLFFKSKAVQRILLVLVVAVVGAIAYFMSPRPAPSPDSKFLTDLGLTISEDQGKLTITNVDLKTTAVIDRPLANDVVSKVNGDPVVNIQDFLVAAKQTRPTMSTIDMEVRGDNGTKVRRTVAIRPPGQKSASSMIGARGIHLDWLLPNPGVVITDVTTGTPADGKLQVDDVLLSEGGNDVRIVDDLERPMTQSSTNSVVVTVLRAGGQVNVTLTSGSSSTVTNIVITVVNNTNRQAYFCDADGRLRVLTPDAGGGNGIPPGASRIFTVPSGKRYAIHPPSITKGSTPHAFVAKNLGVLAADGSIPYDGR